MDEIDAVGTKRYDSNSGGEREIQRLRKKFTQDQKIMDLKRFHTCVLRCMGPLGDLEACVLNSYFYYK